MKLQRPLATVVVSLTICLSVIAQNTTFQGRVIDVIDGTTVIVETQSKTQFHVRCPGAVAQNKQQSFGSESQQRLSSLVLGELVTVKASKRDENGNLLGTIWLNEHDICLEQVKSGLAWLDEDQTNGLTSSARRVYATAESNARNRTIGVWTDNTASSQVSSTREVNQQPTSTSSTGLSTDSHPLTTDNSNSSTVDVRSYFRADGTFVPAHKRTGPDDRVDNNWSTIGNVNPYTGKPGNRSWFRRNWWIFPTVGALIGTGYLINRYSNNVGGGGIVCRDGSLSPAQNRQGACSHHGGILP